MSTVRKLIYIMGCSHCGSTLLTRVLARHSQIATVGELKMSAIPDYRHYQCGCGAKLLECPFWKQVAVTCAAEGVELDFGNFGTHYRVKGSLAGRIIGATVRGTGLEAVRKAACSCWPPAARALARINRRNKFMIERICDVLQRPVFLDDSKDPTRLMHLCRTGDHDIRVPDTAAPRPRRGRTNGPRRAARCRAALFPGKSIRANPVGLQRSISTEVVKTRILIVRDRASSGGGIFNYYQAVTSHLAVRHRFVDVGRCHSYYGSETSCWISRIPTPLRMLFDWVNLVVGMIGWPGPVHLNPSLDPVEMRSLRRDAVNLCLAKLFRRRVIIFWRGWENDACGTPEFPCGNRGWMSRVYRWADAHIVLANDFRDDLRRWGFNSPIYLETTVVPDLIIDTLKGRHKQDDGVFRILFLSRVEVAKGVFEMLEAFALLGFESPGRYHLTVAGDGPDLENLKARANQLGLNNIEFTGYVDGEGKVRCLSNASAFCFLSYTEGMPNAVLEAMAAGLPLVSSDAGGLKDILDDGVTGYIVTQDRSKARGERFGSEEIAERIKCLAASEELCRRIGTHNRKYALERFSATKVASRLEMIYREVFEPACQ